MTIKSLSSSTIKRDARGHIHVESDDNYVKFWLEPLDLAKSVGYKNIELSEIRRMIQENLLLLKASWDAHFGS
jgi:hypothetical protein